MRSVDLIYLTHNRLAFTYASFGALLTNTDWRHVRNFYWYDDHSTDGTLRFASQVITHIPSDVIDCRLMIGEWGSPVAVMNHYLSLGNHTSYLAKIDNDTIVPRGWLTECLHVMNNHPILGLLGIEAFDPVEPAYVPRTYRRCEHIGGIGLMRPELLAKEPPEPSGQRFGFTEWQHRHREVVKGWLAPALPVLLLDRIPFEPWRSLSKEYLAKGWQREWPLYSAHKNANIWPWIERGIPDYEPETVGLIDQA